ncbi:hypothetical protein GGX14DRAFT_402840 [Mycena pura]|uniref:Uncharacterized protein n=1 Tax=Mycena pura TaxID=153505 RepID=A0AAD6V0V2_9AGAR|nr:hypothetical protein GGX14DRAFT_402840 [Mycena pura]
MSKMITWLTMDLADGAAFRVHRTLLCKQSRGWRPEIYRFGNGIWSKAKDPEIGVNVRRIAPNPPPKKKTPNFFSPFLKFAQNGLRGRGKIRTTTSGGRRKRPGQARPLFGPSVVPVLSFLSPDVMIADVDNPSDGSGDLGVVAAYSESGAGTWVHPGAGPHGDALLTAIIAVSRGVIRERIGDQTNWAIRSGTGNVPGT